MDINEQLGTIVNDLVQNLKISLEQELQDKISNEVISKLASLEIESMITNLISQKLETINFLDLGNRHITSVVESLKDQVSQNILKSAADKINTDINQSLSTINLPATINAIINNQLKVLLTDATFPDNSIPHTAVNFSNVKLTGDVIHGGVINNFSSIGIQDLSTFVQVTLMDNGTVFEGPIYSPELNIKGPGQIEGDLTVTGNLNISGTLVEGSHAFKQVVQHCAEITHELLKQSLNTDWYSTYATIIFNKIKDEGLELNHITQDGKTIVNGNQLGYHIVDTNIQRLGMVRDLQTTGEALLSETLYTTKKRVGINTLDPSSALSVWDEECELVMSKRKTDVGYIGSPRHQSVILGSNNKENITLEPDGSATFSKINVGKISLSSSDTIPSYDAPKGHLVYNELPDIGQPVYWVSLGGARWGNGPIIT